MFNALMAKILSGVSVALALLAVGLGVKIHSLNGKLAAATGQIATLNLSNATLRANQAGLQAGVQACNASVEAYEQVATSLASAGQAAVTAARKAGETLDARIAAIKAMPAATCRDAEAILRSK